ncbi:hypothetical protein ACLKA6_000620 [Drosophila palustris]
MFISGRGRGHGRGFDGWRQFGPPLPFTGCASRCHRVCGKCCVGWEAAPPSANTASAAAPQAAAPPGWVRIEDLRPAQAAIKAAQWVQLDADGNVPPAQPRPVAQPVAQWVQLDADGNVPPAQPRPVAQPVAQWVQLNADGNVPPAQPRP